MATTSKDWPDMLTECNNRILQATDPDGFASLVVLNRQWRHISQRTHLYEAQLLRCPSYAASHMSLPTADRENLPRLRRLFALEAKRNLFECYKRPSKTSIKLISTSNSSSSCPGGEGMQFTASPRGHHLLAYNSSRIYLLDVYDAPEMQVKREFKIQRRPVAVCVTDDASLLAVLSSEMQVNLFDLTQSPPRRKQAIILDNTPRTIAMSSCGTVLATAYDEGIEVSSIHPGALPTDRRSVKCDAVDSLAFSYDGTQIMGTTSQLSSSPTTVILTAPYFDPGNLLMDDNLSAMWTTSILFPNTSHDCSHAVLLQNGTSEEATWAFTYDRSFESFRAIRIEDLRNGTTYFTGPVPKESSQAKLLPSTLPAASYRGNLAAAGFDGKDVWIYGVPEDLNAVPIPAGVHLETGMPSLGLGRHNSNHTNLSRNGSSRSREAPQEGQHVPQWQLLVDKLRNNFVSGHKISELQGLNNLKWIADYGRSSLKERLVLSARGVSPSRLATDEEDIDFVDGGRMVLLDFDYGLVNGKHEEITIELGTDHAEALEEEQRSLETEVAIARRRTVAQRKKGQNSLLRAATTAAMPPLPRGDTTQGGDENDDDPLIPRTIGRNLATSSQQEDEGEASDMPSLDEMEALDAPYAHASPRSGTTLRRAATAAAVNRTLNPRTADGRRIEFRRADGRREHPHESDADNWVPPPPPYQKDDPGDTPAFLRGRVVAPLVSPVPPLPTSHIARGSGSQTWANSAVSGAGSPGDVVYSESSGIGRRPSHQRTASDSTTYSNRPRIDDFSRPRSSPLEYLPSSAGSAVTTSPEAGRLQDIESSPSTAPLMSATGGLHLRRHDPSVDPMGLFTDNTSTTRSPSSAASQSTLPALDTRIASSRLQDVTVADGSVSAPLRRLSNAQTWPRRVPVPSTAASSSLAPPHVAVAPLSAPATQTTMDEVASSLPPAPNPDQLARLSRRISVGHPSRLSGGVSSHWTLGESSRSQSYGPSLPLAYQPHSYSQESSAASPIINADEERPLIISTPRGVAGAFDSPEKMTSVQRTETPILAPVPRRPRQEIPFNSRQQPIRREPLYSPSAIQAYNAENQRARTLPSWLQSPPMSTSRTSLNRKPSRAERSAAKNMLDARRRGWKPKSKKPKKSTTASSEGEWADISPVAASKDKKCVVM